MQGLLRGRLLSTILALLGIAAITLVCYRLHASATVSAILLFLAVLVAALQGKIGAAMIASIAATLCLDYFFVQPLLSISIADPEGWVALLVFLSASLVAARMSGQLRRNRDELISNHAESDRFHALSRAMLLSSGSEEVGRSIVNKCMELFGSREIVLFDSGTGAFHRSQSPASISEEKLRRAAVNGCIEQSPADGEIILPVMLGNRCFGSLGLRGVDLGQQTLQTLASAIALGLAQSQAQEASARAEAVRRGEELKSIMIDALAHDLKTPLTAIEAAADILVRPANVSEHEKRDLLSVIQEEARGLRRLVDEAIHLARIDAHKLKLDYEPTRIPDVIEKAIQSLGELAAQNRIEVELETGLPLVNADEELLVQAIKQVLDNATKYSPPNSMVTVSGRHESGMVSVAVRDHGHGLTELEQRKIFDKFYRGRSAMTGVQGSGMGLSIAKEILQAHGGSVRVESKLGEGSLFTIQLKALPQHLSRPAEVVAK